MKQSPIDVHRSFDRPVYCILGLPFDALTMDGAIERLAGDIAARRRCVLATPNVNFLSIARRDAGFRKSVRASDLSVADGMPVVWIARLLGLPLPGRVAGADLIDALAERGPANGMRCFFFGGEDDAAERACRNLERRGGGLHCAGALNPGVGDVASLSKPDIIERINASRPDFLVVSLGALKGQGWIADNARRLNATVISHLGAVVNFHAGTVRRAPAWMRRCGLEWLYRVGQEPALAKRYLRDGLTLCHLFVTRVLPSALSRWSVGRRQSGPVTITVNTDARGQLCLRMQGRFGEGNLGKVREAFAEAAAGAQSLTLDFSAVESIDAAFTGTLLVLKKVCDDRSLDLHLEGVPRNVARALRWQCADDLLQPPEP